MPRKAKPKAQTAANQTKLFVLDTNVLLHDPTSLYRFQEHDIYLPMVNWITTRRACRRWRATPAR